MMLHLIAGEKEDEMNDLMVTGFKDYVFYVGAHPAGLGGNQMIFRFPNDFGASIVQTPFSYGGHDGKLELAVLLFTGEDDWEITYDTDITDDVIGHLEPSECLDLLNQIMALPIGRPEPREDRHRSGDLDELLDSMETIVALSSGLQ